MNILIAPNNYYVMPGIVMLQSLFEQNPGPIDIYVLQSDLTQDNIVLLQRFIEKHNGTLHMITIPKSLFENAHTSIHITKESYYRLLAQDLLPQELSRVLYLDLDLIITGSLLPLYNDDMMQDGKECFFTVCEGPGVSQREWKNYDALSIPHEYRYFNSGVLLMNLSLLREKTKVQTMLDFIEQHGDTLKYHDQDTLNALFYDKVKYVDWHVYNQTILHIKDKQEAEQRLQHAAIIHYAGSDKPWNYDYKSWYFSLFWTYARRAGYTVKYLLVAAKRCLWHLGNHIKKPS